ncbi:hypothetical protein V5O48_001910 [Marasmius crinis-equi]|uniref:Deacetylase sirtuin-type domain-containing protein n=1 Tax=Marasmius crinis-equi TaxID=585013 RepID=A0ABR3FX66_9AGAR
MRSSRPNEGHRVLARLCTPSSRKPVAPHAKTITHVTQNIDGLNLAALANLEHPDGQIIEMHGNIYDVVCTAHDCDYRAKNMDNPICPALGGTENIVAEGNVEPVVKRADLPHCPQCQQLLRPDVVWFGERPKKIHEILNIADEVDLCLVVGTSAVVRLFFHLYSFFVSDDCFQMKVQPASRLPERVRAHGGKVAVFNMEAANHSDEADFLFLGPCEVELGRILGL